MISHRFPAFLRISRNVDWPVKPHFKLNFGFFFSIEASNVYKFQRIFISICEASSANMKCFLWKTQVWRRSAFAMPNFVTTLFIILQCGWLPSWIDIILLIYVRIHYETLRCLTQKTKKRECYQKSIFVCEPSWSSHRTIQLLHHYCSIRKHLNFLWIKSSDERSRLPFPPFMSQIHKLPLP